MQPLDWLIISIYALVMFGLGLYFMPRAGKSITSYFIAGRKLSWWAIGFSSTASYTGAAAAPLFTMLVFQYGLIGNWWWLLPFAIWMPLVAVLWSKFYRRLRIVTTAEFMELRFGGRESRLFRGLYALVMSFGWAVFLNAFAIAWIMKVLAPVFSWSDFAVVLFALILTLIYSTLGGLFGVVYSDIIQFILFFSANIIFVPVILQKVGGLSAVYEGALLSRGPEFFHPLPPFGEIAGMTLVMLLIQGLFFASSPAAGEGYTAQRFLAARNEFHAQIGQLFSSFLALIVRVIPFLFLGIIAASAFPLATTDPDRVWGLLISRFSFSGLTGILIATQMSAFMSTVDSHSNWAGSLIINDVYRLFIRKEASERHYVIISRLSSAAILIISALFGFFFIDRLMAWFLFINSVMVVFILPLSWLRFFWWRHNIYGEAAAVIFGIPFSYIIWFPLGFSDTSQHPFWHGFLILFISGWAVILLADLLTRQEKMDKLKRFYSRCRPPGFWGPVKRELNSDEVESIKKENRLDFADLLLACLLSLSSVSAVMMLFSRRYLLFILILIVTVGSGLKFFLRWKQKGVFKGLKE